MTDQEKNNQVLFGSEDPYCPMRKMLAQAILKNSGFEWEGATDDQKKWALGEALSVQKENEVFARSLTQD